MGENTRTNSPAGENSGDVLLVSIPRARQILGGIGRTQIYNLFKPGVDGTPALQTVHIQSRRFVLVESIRDYVERLKVREPGPSPIPPPQPPNPGPRPPGNPGGPSGPPRADSSTS